MEKPILPCPILTVPVTRTGKWRAEMEDGTFRDFETREEADKVRWSMLSPLHQHPNGLYASHELPPGSVYEVTDWGYAAGLDGRAFNVVCPDGWVVS